MDAGSLRREVRKILADAGVPFADFEADQIICDALRRGRASLHAHPEAFVDPGVFSRITESARYRAQGAPLSYVLGSALFCGRQFRVRPGVLIPRPETEILTCLADGILKRTRGKVFADWCAGSGCIAVVLLLENPEWRCFAVDSSEDALLAARENAELHGVSGRITFVRCREPASAQIPPASLDLVVSNPPYIPTGAIDSLESQVRDHEPKEALDGGPDGLCVYRALFAGLPRLMKPESHLLLETGGDEQAERILAFRRDPSDHGGAGGLRFVRKFSDHRGISRFMLWQKINTAKME
jgi:release factor glutamine methyltransferase